MGNSINFQTNLRDLNYFLQKELLFSNDPK